MTAPNTPAYNPNIPTRDMVYADWQTNFLANFERLYLDFAKNHVTLDSASNAGNHTVMQLIEQEDSQQTGATEISVYTKKVEGQTDQIFMKYGNGTEFQVTLWQIYPVTYISNQTLFISFLPGNIMVNFGQYTVTAGQGVSSIIEFKPYAMRNILSINITGGGTASSVYTATLNINPGGYFTGMTIPTATNLSGVVLNYIVTGNL